MVDRCKSRLLDMIVFATRKLTGVKPGLQGDDGNLAALTLQLLLEFELR